VDDAASDADDVDDGGGLGPVAVALLLVGAALSIAGLTALVPGWLLAVGLLTFVAGAAAPLGGSWRRRREDDHDVSAR